MTIRIIALILALVMARPGDAAELVMVEQPGCGWCAHWDAEISAIYPKTPEGKAAPLRRVDLRRLPEDLALDRKVQFTPTFILTENGKEMSRIEGYPGEDFFWGLLALMLQENTDFKGAS